MGIKVILIFVSRCSIDELVGGVVSVCMYVCGGGRGGGGAHHCRCERNGCVCLHKLSVYFANGVCRELLDHVHKLVKGHVAVVVGVHCVHHRRNFVFVKTVAQPGHRGAVRM
jgi:hypothetical protein